MKKLNYFIAMLLVATMAFVSCTEETDPTPPSITVSANTDATFEQGSTVVYTITVSSNEKLDALTATPSTAGAEGTTAAADLMITEDYTQTLEYTYVIPTSLAVDSEVTIDFVVTDAETENSVTETFTVVAGAGAITSYSAVLMGAQANATEGSYLDASTGEVYLMTAANEKSELIDVIYYFGASNEATLCAPSDETVGGGDGNLDLAVGMTTKNATMFATTTMSADDFDAIADDAAITAVETLDATKMTNLVEGNVIAFETVDGKKGMLKVATIVTGTDGSITIDVKIQSDAVSKSVLN